MVFDICDVGPSVQLEPAWSTQNSIHSVIAVSFIILSLFSTLHDSFSIFQAKRKIVSSKRSCIHSCYCNEWRLDKARRISANTCSTLIWCSVLWNPLTYCFVSFRTKLNNHSHRKLILVFTWPFLPLKRCMPHGLNDRLDVHRSLWHHLLQE